MRILRLTGWEGPTAGGAEEYQKRVSGALNRAGHVDQRAAIVTRPPPKELGIDRFFAVSSSQAKVALKAKAGMIGDRALTVWLDQLAREFRPNLIHLHAFRWSFLGLAEWIAGREEPVVFTAHDTEQVCPISTLTLPDGTACPGGILPRCGETGCKVGHGLSLNLKKRELFDRCIKPKLSAIICTSTAVKTVFDNLGYGPAEVIHPIVEVPKKPASPPDGPFTVGFLGRFEPQKGVRVLLDAFHIVKSTFPEARLKFAGSGSVPIPEGNGVTLDGWVSDRYDWFSGIHVLASPSLPFENLGMAAIEALGHGVPAIVGDSGGQPESVGPYGYVVRSGDPEALAKKIIEVAGDYSFARSRALEGREWVREEFSEEKHLRELTGVYESALRSRTANILARAH